MKHITVNTYRKDKYYSRVVRAVGKLLARADVVAPTDILIEMGNLSKKNYEVWRKGQVPYLERVFEGSLSKANRILRIIGFHVHDLNMVSRQTVYHQWGKGKNRILRFSKSADPNIEKAYSRHYSWNQSPQKKQIAINNALPERIRLDCVSEANHNLNRLLDKPGSIIRKYLLGGVLNLSQEGVGCVELCFLKLI